MSQCRVAVTGTVRLWQSPRVPGSVFPSRGAAGAGVPFVQAFLLLELQFRLRLQPDETNSAPFLRAS